MFGEESASGVHLRGFAHNYLQSATN